MSEENRNTRSEDGNKNKHKKRSNRRPRSQARRNNDSSPETKASPNIGKDQITARPARKAQARTARPKQSSNTAKKTQGSSARRSDEFNPQKAKPRENQHSSVHTTIKKVQKSKLGDKTSSSAMENSRPKANTDNRFKNQNRQSNKPPKRVHNKKNYSVQAKPVLAVDKELLKEAETAEDIRKENIAIQKEIALEIADIANIPLQL